MKIYSKIPERVQSPFNGAAALRQRVSVEFVVEHYRRKCGIDVTENFHGMECIGLYECSVTGYKFWRPEAIAGDENFYKKISNSWSNYYREERWEYSHVRKLISKKSQLLEIGCGRGYFLKSIESLAEKSMGIEFNEDAINNKVTQAEILLQPLKYIAAKKKFNIVCAFQVLEHVVDPKSFIVDALECLTQDGILILSTPNNDNLGFYTQQDIFDIPPHHMGHFNPEIYRKIAMEVGCTISKTIIQPREVKLQDTTLQTSSSLIYRMTRYASKRLLSMAYRVNNEPGESILVCMNKK